MDLLNATGSSSYGNHSTNEVLDLLDDAILQLDNGINIVFANAKAAQLFNTTTAQLTGRNALELPHVLAWPLLRSTIELGLKGRVKLNEELVLPSTGMRLSVKITPSSNGAVVVIGNIGENEDRGKFAEERTYELQESKLFIQRVLEASPDHIIVFDLTANKVEFLNRYPYKHDQVRYEETLHIDYEALLNRCHPGDREQLNEFIQSFRTTGDEIRTFDYRVVKENRVLWYRSRGRVFKRDDAGLATHYLSIIQDITETKKAEQELRNAYSQLKKHQSLLQEAEIIGQMGSWEKNLDTGELIWSDELYRIYGLEARSLPMSSSFYIDHFVHPDDKAGVREHIAGIYNAYNEESKEYRIITRHGEKIVHSKPCIVKMANGKAQLIRGIVRDITAQKKAEEALLRLKLTQQKEILNAVLITQEQERERIGEALHNGVGQLLYAIKIKHELLQAGTNKDPVMVEIANVLDETIKETRSISFQLVPTVLKDFGLANALSALLDRIATPGLNTGLSITPPNLRLPENYEIGIYRIIQELVNNIIRHSNATKASVEISKKGRKVKVMVEDNGTGFDVQKTNLMHKGIGIQSLRNRARLLDALLEIDSKPGKGTKVTIDIPITEKP